MDTDVLGVLFGAGFLCFLGIVCFAMLVFYIFLWWRILNKAGYPGPLSLLMIVPFGKIIITLVLAFSEWPQERELRLLRIGLATRSQTCASDSQPGRSGASPPAESPGEAGPAAAPFAHG